MSPLAGWRRAAARLMTDTHSPGARQTAMCDDDVTLRATSARRHLAVRRSASEGRLLCMSELGPRDQVRAGGGGGAAASGRVWPRPPPAAVLSCFLCRRRWSCRSRWRKKRRVWRTRAGSGELRSRARQTGSGSSGQEGRRGGAVRC